VEVAGYAAGPFASGLLADLGANVIKIEPPKGDPFRGFSSSQAMSPQFAAVNRNKRSVVLDLAEDPADRSVARSLLTDSDVFIHNLLPTTITRAGLDYESVREVNDQIVYCAISGLGQGAAGRPTYDTVGQALSGLLSQIIDQDRPQLRGPAFSDLISGMVAAHAVLAALYARARTGVGQRVDVPMVPATASILAGEYLNLTRDGTTPEPRARPAASQAFIFRCRDDEYIAVHLSSPERFWQAFTEAVGASDIRTDPEFATRPDRVASYERLQERLQAHLATRTRADWEKRLDLAGVPYAHVRNLQQALSMDDFIPTMTLEDASGETWTYVAPPALFAGTPVAHLAPPPLLGEHTDELTSAVKATATRV
jgi:formyl-CoA transferase